MGDLIYYTRGRGKKKKEKEKIESTVCPCDSTFGLSPPPFPFPFPFPFPPPTCLFAQHSSEKRNPPCHPQKGRRERAGNYRKTAHAKKQTSQKHAHHAFCFCLLRRKKGTPSFSDMPQKDFYVCCLLCQPTKKKHFVHCSSPSSCSAW